MALGIYLPAEVLIWTGLLLDEVFFPAYHEVKVKQPVFIIGNPRSGSTFLQRLLAKDTNSFISMRTWEIFGSPSILRRKFIHTATKIGRAIGVPISKRIKRLERLWQESDAIHRLALRAPEEDEYLFIHNFSTLKIWSFAAMLEEAYPYIYYEDRISQEDKQRVMDYYESCIQRHLFDHKSSGKHYLSKNPNFSPMIDTLLKKFPDGKFIYLIRNPLNAIPSHLSLKEREWQMLGSPLEEYGCRDFILDASEHWYNYPLMRLKDLPEDQKIIVKFNNLVKNADQTVQRIYDQFGLTVSPKYKKILQRETIRARKHQSQHEYSLSEMGISREQLRERFKDVMLEFDYH
ncbi:MAG: sulfotransferase [Anaerolineales bacterium]|nr:sulfotransferase [Anaerolineales bacterium]